MKFSLIATAIVATSAIRMERELNGVAKNEEQAWSEYQESKVLVDKAEKAYLALKVVSRKQENELKREIDETIKQEAVVAAANRDADASRRSLFRATMAQHKAMESYMTAMAEELKYTK